MKARHVDYLKHFHNLLKDVCCEKRGINPSVLEEVIVLAVEIAREGREGRRIGTIFVVGDSESVLERSQPLILDPLYGHPDKVKSIFDRDMRETVKELCQLDGAFIVSDEGIFISACRYLDASSEGITLPLGLAARHLAGASISLTTGAVAVVVSESSIVRVFDDGEIVSEILPELWLMSRIAHHFNDLASEHAEEHIVVYDKDDEPAHS